MAAVQKTSIPSTCEKTGDDEEERHIDFTEKWSDADVSFEFITDDRDKKATEDSTQKLTRDSADASIEESKQVLYANNTLLSMWSPVFKAQFSGNFKDHNTVLIKDHTFDDMLEMMKVLHPPMKPITSANVYAVLPLLHKYHIQQLLTQCEQVLLRLPVTLHNLLVAEIFNFPLLEQQSMIHIAKYTTIETMQNDKDFNRLSLELRYKLLSNKSLGLEKRLYTSEEKAFVNLRRALYTVCGKDMETYQIFGGKRRVTTFNFNDADDFLRTLYEEL